MKKGKEKEKYKFRYDTVDKDIKILDLKTK